MRSWILAIAMVAGIARVASAHQSSVKYVDITVERARASVKLTVAPTDVTEPLGLPPDARPSAADAAIPKVAGYVRTWIGVAVPSSSCTAGAASAAPDPDGKFVVVAWDVTCPEAISEIALDFTGFFAADRRHEAILTVHAPGAEVDPRVVRETVQRFSMRVGESGSVLPWIRSGIHHIFGGIDHICFVLSLLLVVVLQRGRTDRWETRTPLAALRATAAIVTAFTIAHSLSLIAASLGWIRLPSRLVESLIAASIVYTAVEDVIRPDVRWRFALTFGFGLVHGLGFASVLEETLPANHVIVPLLSFNVGVELGQLAIVGVALPVFWALSRGWGAQTYRRVIVPIAATPLVLIAIKWLIERALDITTFSLWGM